MSEYGRGMGPIHRYTGGLGRRIPTGWPSDDNYQESSHGIFKTILRSPDTTSRSKTHWGKRFARAVSSLFSQQLAGRTPRLWWAYGRKDSASTHAFRLLTKEDRGSQAAPEVAKLIPIAEDGSLASGATKTTGELLKEQVDALVDDPEQQVKVDITAPSEMKTHSAGQISQLLIHILTRDLQEEEKLIPEIIVAPNAGIRTWAGTDVVRISSLELVDPRGKVTSMTPGRPVFLVAQRVPRHEMRSFLESCEPAVVATGDQSISEAVLLGKVPFVKPDAKVAQWELALATLSKGKVDEVPDLGQILRDILSLETVREKLARRSQLESEQIEARLVDELGISRTPTQELLIRAGMYG
eukprot:TRINITY_DN109260_c0_g1_i1.p1 TRINITY_DN109260_c0_g1~~TRINITY_DN109260_c0_g1_i1.p1  ORF type:complete len:365 (+),score=45.27 TRINITY_DN109260_c0_g1_i1:32-1096(+)